MPETPSVILSPKNDFVFKQLFGDPKHTDPLAALLKSTLPLPPEEFTALKITDPNLNRRFKGDKLSILDVRVVTRSGRDVDVEIQVVLTPDLLERILFYLAKMVAGKVKSGKSYEEMPQSICIVIVDDPLWDDAPYRHRFRMYDSDAGLEYPNSMEIHTLELPKVPVNSDGTELWRWLKFISSETRDEFERLAGKDTVMAETVERLVELSASEKARRRAEAREKWLWDQASRMRHSRQEGLAEGRAEGRVEGRAEGRVEGLVEGEAKGETKGRAAVARQLLLMQMPFADIAKATGLSESEIKRLSAAEEIADSPKTNAAQKPPRQRKPAKRPSRV